MLRSYLTIIAGLLVISGTAIAQAIEGRILEDKTNNPIPFANVYFNNSMNGTASDADGYFKLDVSQNMGQDITISFVGYETQNLKGYIPGKFYEIHLKPLPFMLKEIVVYGDNKERNRFENVFTREFLGQNVNLKYCTIENIEDLRFSYNDTTRTLIAHSIEPLIIQNRWLGYRVKYFLDEFRVESGRVSYRGNSLFEEDTSFTETEYEKIKERRRKAYLGSRMQFFRLLWNDQIRRSKFMVYDLSNEKSTDLKDNVMYGTVNVKFLVCLNSLEIHYAQSDPSFLNIDSPVQILFTKTGYFDPNGHTWSGEMAKQRVADLLPYEYWPGQ